jgi:hypothetical protein
VTHTDARGHFEFEGAWKRAVVDLLHQPVVHEEVFVEYNSTNHAVLDVTKMDYDSFGELYAVHLHDPSREDRLSKKNEKLYLKFDLDSDKAPIGRPR